MTEKTAPSRIKLRYLVASEMSLSAHISPFKALSIKKDAGNYSWREEARAAPRLVLALEGSRAGKDQHMNCAQLVDSIHAQKNTRHGGILNLFLHGSLSKLAFVYRSQNKNWIMLRTALRIFKVGTRTIETHFYSSLIVFSSTPYFSILVLTFLEDFGSSDCIIRKL